VFRPLLAAGRGTASDLDAEDRRYAGGAGLLESLLEESKPALPPECQGLDYLLATPFRYGAVYPHGSRFRRAGRTLGVYYASEKVETALAEMAFYRLLFFADSPDTPLPSNAAEYTAFSAAIETARAIDLTAPPLDRDHATWSDPTRYEPCQSLADAAREAECQAILYASVRDPSHGRNIALLTRIGLCRARTAGTADMAHPPVVIGRAGIV
jgi:hypothetical protein